VGRILENLGGFRSFMKAIEKNGVLYAVVHRKDEWKEGLDFLTANDTFIQAGTWWYHKGKKLNTHKHIPNERVNTITQECIVVMSGSVKVDLYDENDSVFRSEVLVAGDLMIMLAGGHGYEILAPDTKIIECKNGPFVSVEKDKVLI
jgi:hypothetical protein